MPRTRSQPPARPAYPSNLTGAQWALVAATMPLATNGRTGWPRRYPLRYPLRGGWNAVLYLTRNGCTWRALPHDFPPWPVVWEHFRRWRDAGTLERVHAALRTEVRVRAGREPTPRLVIADCESAMTAERGPKDFDAGNKVERCKRHLAVDTLGLIWVAVVHSAGVQDRDGIRLMAAKLGPLRPHDGRPPLLGRHRGFPSSSLSTRLPRARSATSCLSRRFSSSSTARSHRASLTCGPPNSRLQR